jgi:hypothetical protein
MRRCKLKHMACEITWDSLSQKKNRVMPKVVEETKSKSGTAHPD